MTSVYDKEAGKNLMSARKGVEIAIKHLSAIIIEQCNGCDDLPSLTHTKLRGAMNQLLDCRESLK